MRTRGEGGVWSCALGFAKKKSKREAKKERRGETATEVVQDDGLEKDLEESEDPEEREEFDTEEVEEREELELELEFELEFELDAEDWLDEVWILQHHLFCAASEQRPGLLRMPLPIHSDIRRQLSVSAQKLPEDTEDRELFVDNDECD